MELPLIHKAGSLFDTIDLGNCILIACQHILGTTTPMVEELIQRGLEPSSIFILGKCYSTNNEVLEQIKNQGIYVSDLSTEYQSHMAFDDQYKSHVRSFLLDISSKVLVKGYDRIIVLDDGGELILQLTELNLFRVSFAVEQTSSGIRKLRDIELPFPLINVARSNAKLNYESPFIAQKAVEVLMEALRNYAVFAPKVLIVGQGSIGSALTAHLSQWDIEVHDITSHGTPFFESHKDTLEHYDVIIGTTGDQIIRYEESNLLKKRVILASVSSSDREFDAVAWRLQIPQNDNCHLDVQIDERVVLNSGFPINFTGEAHSVAPKKIQLTRALMLCGIYQGISHDLEKGINALDDKMAREFSDQFIELLRA